MNLLILIPTSNRRKAGSARVDKGQTTATELIDWGKIKLHTTQEDDFKDTDSYHEKYSQKQSQT